MGSPQYPTPAELQALRQAAQLPAPEKQNVSDGRLLVALPAHGLAVIELK
jgi:hypothetical protein